MPLPKEPLTIHGGCHCGAVRYKVSIPAYEERPVHYTLPASMASDPTTPRFPCVVADHCNDCRTATGSMLTMWLQVPADMFSMSCLPRTTTTNEPDEQLVFPEDATMPRRALAPRPDSTDSTRPPYVPGHAIASGRDAEAGGSTWLSCYLTRYDPGGVVPRIIRSFCGRCGTNLFYTIDPTPFGWPGFLDVALGTVDRGDLELEHMQPEHQFFWASGIPWVKEMAGGLPADKHAEWNIMEKVE